MILIIELSVLMPKYFEQLEHNATYWK